MVAKFCPLPHSSAGAVCPVCGFELLHTLPKVPKVVCGSFGNNPKPPKATTSFQGLGDLVEAGLTRIGITKESWIAWKDAHGWPPTCNCDARRIWLNEFGRKFGKPAKIAVRLAMRLWAKGESSLNGQPPTG